MLAICRAAVGRREKKDDPSLFVDLVEEAPGPDAVAPSRRLKAPEPSDVWPHVRMLTQLWVHHPS